MFRLLVSFLLTFMLWSTAWAQPAERQEHLLGPGDVIRVSVYQNPDLTLETRVSDQGPARTPGLADKARPPRERIDPAEPLTS